MRSRVRKLDLNLKPSRVSLPILVSIALLVSCTGGSGDPQATTVPMGTTTSAPGQVGTTEPEPTPEDEVAAFYAANDITLIVATEPGGGFDTYARMVARYLGEYIPGNPRIIVQNMPGAGHLLATNWAYRAAPRDGTTIVNTDDAPMFHQLIGIEGLQADMTEMSYLGTIDPPNYTVLVARADAGISHISDVFGDDAQELVVGVPLPGSRQADPAILLGAVLGANLRIVSGYSGTGPLTLALEQGEIDALVTTWSTFSQLRADQLESGEFVVLMQFSNHPLPGLEGVPMLLDYAESQEQEDLLQAGVLDRVYVRNYWLPPDVPEDRLAALREAWSLVQTDERLLEIAERAGLEVGGASGEELQAAIERMLSLPEELVSELRGYIAPPE